MPRRSDPMNPQEYGIMYNIEDGYWWYVGHREIARSIISDYISNRTNLKILDIGCGTGGNHKLLSAYGQVYSVDLSFEAAKFIRKRSIENFVIGSATELPFASDSFDLVTSFNLIECVANDTAAFAEYRRVLKRGGILYMSTAAFESLKGEHDLAVGTVHRYNRRQLMQRLKNSGLEVLRITCANTLLAPPTYLIRRGMKLLKSAPTGSEAKSEFNFAPRFLNGFFKAMLYAEARILKYIDLPFGVSIIGVARKP